MSAAWAASDQREAEDDGNDVARMGMRCSSSREFRSW